MMSRSRNDLRATRFRARYIRRTKSPASTPQNRSANTNGSGAGHPARRLRSVRRFRHCVSTRFAQAIGVIRGHTAVSISPNTNKTLTSDDRASGSIVTRESSHEPLSDIRFCIDIDSESAFNQCSVGFSAACKSLPNRQIRRVFRGIRNPPFVRVAYSDRSV